MVPKAPEHNKIHQNMSLGSNGVDQECSLPKILTRFRGTNFCINRTSLARFEPSFIRPWNGPNYTQTIRNTPKQEFRVQWGGSGAFFVKYSDPTSWHELLHWLYQFGPFWTEFCKALKWSRKHPNTTKRTKTWVQSPMGQTRSIRYEKF